MLDKCFNAVLNTFNEDEWTRSLLERGVLENKSNMSTQRRNVSVSKALRENNIEGGKSFFDFHTASHRGFGGFNSYTLIFLVANPNGSVRVNYVGNGFASGRCEEPNEHANYYGCRFTTDNPDEVVDATRHYITFLKGYFGVSTK